MVYWKEFCRNLCSNCVPRTFRHN